MFSAGVDFTTGKQIADGENGERFSYFMATALSQLRRLPQVTLALLQGETGISHFSFR